LTTLLLVSVYVVLLWG